MTATMTENLTDLLKRLRNERGYTQAQVADGVVEHGGKAGTAAVSLWENGGDITYRNAKALADFFGAPELLAVVGFDADEYETLAAKLERQDKEIAKLRRAFAALERRLRD